MKKGFSPISSKLKLLISGKKKKCYCTLLSKAEARVILPSPSKVHVESVSTLFNANNVIVRGHARSLARSSKANLNALMAPCIPLMVETLILTFQEQTWVLVYVKERG